MPPHAASTDMLDVLVADPSLVEDDVVAVLRASMLASFGSPGVALSWAVREITEHEEVRRQLSAEARQVLASGGSLDDDSSLPYSRAFVREILRMYPPTWLMGRIVRRDCTLGEWPLRVGQEVMFSPYLLQRDPRWWPEPDALLPDRWLSRAATDSRRAYIPFGSGPRVCLGLYQLITAVSHLAAHYEIWSGNGASVAAVPHAILVSEGLRARIQPVQAGAAPVVTVQLARDFDVLGSCQRAAGAAQVRAGGRGYVGVVPPDGDG
jgi:cytochrome P450